MGTRERQRDYITKYQSTKKAKQHYIFMYQATELQIYEAKTNRTEKQTNLQLLETSTTLSLQMTRISRKLARI
jgi:hypothetical protein